MDSIPISETISLQSIGLDEAWLQAQIWETPSCLGLGELEGVTKERILSSGGRLDILLKNPNDDSMYEVETMLGETDPSHIVRTIEYWDLIKRKWPQRQHYAVLVAERITKRFFNVIQILSDAVPLIAIQVNIVQSPNGQSLHFTKILDVYEEPDDETSVDDGTYDESYWTNKSNATLKTAQLLLDVTREVYVNPELRFNKNYIAIVSGSNIQLRVRKRSGNNVLIGFRYGNNREDIQIILESNDIQYTEKNRHFRLQMSSDIIREKSGMFIEIAKLNKEWWIG